MIYLNNCSDLINKGIILRILVTILILPLLNPIKNSYYFLLIIPIILTILDSLDTFFITYEIYKKTNIPFLKRPNCTIKYKKYQISDKINDILSYIIFYIYFYDILKDKLLEFFIFYRLIGVINFVMTGNKNNIIIFFDFVKEYILYKFIFNKIQPILFVFIIFKIIFEYIFHKKWNNPDL